MSILFMMPQWQAVSETWMHRMMQGISDEISVVVVNNTWGNAYWNGTIPAVSLSLKVKKIRYVSTLFHHLGYSFGTKTDDSQDILRRTTHRFPISSILCQYGTFAVKFMDIWQETDIPLFLHFHGYDTFIDLCEDDHPCKKVHPKDYLDNLKILEKRATFIAGSNFLKSCLVNWGISPEKIIVKYYGVPITQIIRTYQQKEDIQILHLGRLVDFNPGPDHPGI